MLTYVTLKYTVLLIKSGINWNSFTTGNHNVKYIYIYISILALLPCCMQNAIRTLGKLNNKYIIFLLLQMHDFLRNYLCLALAAEIRWNHPRPLVLQPRGDWHRRHCQQNSNCGWNQRHPHGDWVWLEPFEDGNELMMTKREQEDAYLYAHDRPAYYLIFIFCWSHVL